MPALRIFLPMPVLRRVFRGKFVDGLKSAFQRDQLRFSGDLSPLAQPKIFAAWLRPLFRKDWVVYSKPFGGPEYVLHYLGRYTHRVATIPTALTRGLAPATGVVRPSSPHTRSPLPTSTQSLAPTSHKPQPNPSWVRIVHPFYLFRKASP